MPAPDRVRDGRQILGPTCVHVPSVLEDVCVKCGAPVWVDRFPRAGVPVAVQDDDGRIRLV